MNTQVRNKSKLNRAFYIPAILIALITLWYMVYESISTVRYASQMNSLNDSIFAARIGSQFSVPGTENFTEELIEKEKQKAFLNSRIIMSRPDSVRLTINLPDSILQLEIRGLVVHTSKILKYNASGLLQRKHALLKAHWISEPFQAVKNYSTIPREPIVVVYAPADTIEAQNAPELVPEPDKTNIYFTYVTDKNLIIHVNQSENGKKDGYLFQNLLRNYKKFKNSVDEMIKFKNKEIVHSLELTISMQDAKTIYRALPEYPMITVRL